MTNKLTYQIYFRISCGDIQHHWYIHYYSPSPCPCGHKAGIIWNIATCEQFTVKGKKKLIILFENNVKNIQMKTIFEMMSLHCVPYILYWIQADWKFYIQTYCQIIWVNFANMVTIIFFQADVHIWLTPPLPPVPHFCLTPSPLTCGHPLWMIWKAIYLFNF